MQLFEFKNYQLSISPQAYALKPFAAIWNRDKSTGKKKAIQQLSYVFFYVDFRSDFSGIFDDDERHEAVCLGIDLETSYKPDKLVLAAMEYYRRMSETPTLRLLRAVKKSLDRLTDYFDTVDFNAVDKAGKLTYDLAKYKSTVKDLAEMVDSMDKLDKKVKSELRQASEAGGSREKGLMEDFKF